MWVKICGITDPAIAAQVASLGPDAIGLNFYDRSPRCVSVEIAREIVTHLPAGVEPVGLFVNSSREYIHAACQQVGLRTIQLHGDETPEFMATLADYRIIRAFRVGPEGLDAAATDLKQCSELGVPLQACLIDARVPGAYGGTGHVVDWSRLRLDWNKDWPPLILAGGLTPELVRQAIRLVRPYGVDVASGVEESPGRQSLDKVRDFIAASRRP